MIAKNMVDYVKGSSVIRAMFEEGKKLAEKYGAENVYDFSLGNPSVEPDKSGKDISRACFLPHDPEAYINPLYK